MKWCLFERGSFYYPKVITTILWKTVCKGNPKTMKISKKKQKAAKAFFVTLRVFQGQLVTNRVFIETIGNILSQRH